MIKLFGLYTWAGYVGGLVCEAGSNLKVNTTYMQIDVNIRDFLPLPSTKQGRERGEEDHVEEKCPSTATPQELSFCSNGEDLGIHYSVQHVRPSNPVWAM